MSELIIVGGGLAGSEAAWQAAERGVKVILYEMRPNTNTPAHKTPHLGELVCSNSLGSKLIDRASGLLNAELKRLGSLLVDCAERCAVPAGSALSVDRNVFATLVTKRITNHPNIRVMREEMAIIPMQPCIIASGPLTSNLLIADIQKFTGRDNLFFFDAIAPIVDLHSIDFFNAFFGSRYGRGDKKNGDYINCPFDKEEYEKFVKELASAKRIHLKEFELDITKGVSSGKGEFFEACLPVEILASRSMNALAFGPMRPIGIHNPHKGRRPYAVVQLRQDNLAATLYNMVGFQTNLTYKEQERVFHLIPGLKNARFVRYGQMHRNTYITSPEILIETMQTKKRKDLFFAGQITGIEGYLGSIATGLVAGINAFLYLNKKQTISFPDETAIGSLCHYISHADPKHFQPMKVNLGLLPPLIKKHESKFARSQAKSKRAINVLEVFIQQTGL